MATAQSRPNGNYNTLWTAYAYTNVDDNVVQPNAGDGLTADATFDDDTQRQEWEMDNPLPDGAVISQIVLWARIWTEPAENESVGLQIYIAGGYLGSSFEYSDFAWAWKSATFNGSWTKAQWDAARIALTAAMNIEESIINVDVVYCELTYTTGSALTKDLSDTVTLSDAQAKAIGKVAADALALADSKGVTVGKILSDALTLADLLATHRPGGMKIKGNVEESRIEFYIEMELVGYIDATGYHTA